MKKIDQPPKLDSPDQQKLYSFAHYDMVNKQVTKEEAWWAACFSLLKSKGLAVVDASELQNFLDNLKNRP